MSAPRDSFYVTGGTMRPDAPSYVERAADRELYEALGRGEFCYVLTPRQMGKSSLMVRTAAKLRADGTRVVQLDLTAIGQRVDPEQWYRGLLDQIGQRLDLEQELSAAWASLRHLGPLQRWMRALQEVVLNVPESLTTETRRHGVRTEGEKVEPEASAVTRPLSTPLVIFIDEIDTVRGLPFSTDDFFAAIRHCFNLRAEDPVYEGLTFCLLGVATPTDLIQDTRLTPFNIGRRIELADFTEAEALQLALGLTHHGDAPKDEGGRMKDEGPMPEGQHPSPIPEYLNTRIPDPAAQRLMRRVLHWTGGHPYLTQRLCRALAERMKAEGGRMKGVSASEVDPLCEELFLTRGARSKDDNLLFVRDRLLRSEVDTAALLESYERVRAGRELAVEEGSPLLDVLLLSGIVRRASGRRRLLGAGPALAVRNRIYDRVFDAAWIREQMPDAELRRQRAAFRRGYLRAAAAGAALLAVLGGLSITALAHARQAELAEKKALTYAGRLERALREVSEQRTRAGANLALAEQRGRQAQANAAQARMAAGQARRETSAAREARGNAVAALGREAAERQKATARLVHMTVSHGTHRVDQGDLLAAIPWFTEALRLDRGPRSDDRLHRIRLAATLAQCPRLVRMWFQEGSATPVASEEARRGNLVSGRTLAELGLGVPVFSRDGRFVCTASSGTTARVWRVADGLPAGPPLKLAEPVTRVAFSPDDRRVVTGGERGAARVWDWRSGRPAGPVLKHGGRVAWAEFSPDGRRLLTASYDGAARLWDPRTGRLLTPPMPSDTETTHAVFSPDGRLIATCGGDKWSARGAARLWDARTGAPVRTLPVEPGAPVSTISFNRMGTRLLTAGTNGAVRVFDAASGSPVGPMINHGWVYDAVFSPDGSRIVAADASGAARVWNPVTGQPVTPPMLSGGDLLSVRFSPDGALVVTGGTDQTARVWDALSGDPVTPPLRHNGVVGSAGFGPDGRSILTVSSDGTTRLWDLAAPEPRTPSIYHRGPVAGASFSRDGRRILTAGREDRTARMWDARTGLPLTPPMRHDHQLLSAALSADGRRALTVSLGGAPRIWDAVTGRLLLTLENRASRVPGGAAAPQEQRSDRSGHALKASPAAFSPDGGTVAVGWPDGRVQLRDAATGRVIRFGMRHAAAVTSVAFSPDGRYVATASEDHSVRLWNTATGRPAAPVSKHGASIASLAFSPDSRHLLTGGSDGTARIWNVATGGLAVRLLRHASGLNLAHFAPDGRRVVTASWDGTARVWDAATGAAVTPPLKHRASVSAANFSPDGRCVVTASWDGTIRVWDAVTGEPVTPPLSRLRRRSRTTWAEFSPDGRRIVTSGFWGDVHVWDLAETGSPAAELDRVARLLAGHRVSEGVTEAPMDTAQLRADWQALRGRPPHSLRRPTPREILEWEREEARRCLDMGRWEEGFTHLERVIQADPSGWKTWFHRTGVNPLLARQLEQGNDPYNWYRVGLIQVAAGAQAAYRDTCAAMLERFGASKYSHSLHLTAWTSALAPGALTDPGQAVRLAETAVTLDPGSASPLRSLGAALYRAGRFPESARRLEAALALEAKSRSSSALTRLLLALAFHRMNRPDQARRHLTEGLRLAEEERKGASSSTWHRLALELLQREAKAEVR